MLIIPSILLSLMMLIVVDEHLTTFYDKTQDEVLLDLSTQIMKSFNNSLNHINQTILDLEQRILMDNNHNEISEMINLLGKTRYEYIRGIAVMYEEGLVIGYPELFWKYFSDEEVETIKKNAVHKKRGIFWSPHYYSKVPGSNMEDKSSAVTRVVSDKNGKTIGMIAIIVNLNSFLQNLIIFEGNYNIQVLLYDQKGELASSINNLSGIKNKNLVPKDRKNSITTTINYIKENSLSYALSNMSYHPNWRLLIIGNVKQMGLRFEILRRNMILILIGGILGLVCCYIIVSWWFTIPLSRLTQGIRHVGEGNFDYKIDLKRDDEFGRVASEFNHMSSLIKNLIADLQSTHKKKRISDFNVLVSQINPHFLYNTLNTIDIMIDVGSKEDQHEMIECLVDLMKYSLNEDSQIKYLEEELSYIEKYLFLLLIRYQNRFDYTVQEPGKLGKIKVLKLILQPLVENAVYHGIHPLKKRKGYIEISVKKEQDVLSICVSDNGVGMSQEKADNILKGKINENKDCETGIGLRNVHERIQLYYGEQYGLTIKSQLGEGTIVIARIPIRT